ncbi:MAG: HAD hydrolase-like protein [bacterium]
MKNYRHIIWDWNGTLLDDSRVCFDILNRMLARRGLSVVSQEQYEEEFGFPVIDYYTHVGFDFKKESYGTLAKEFIDEYDLHELECQVRADGIAAIAEFKNRGYRQSILSALEQSRLHTATLRLSLQHYFDDLVGVADYLAGGKIERGMQYIVGCNNCNAEEILMIGDTPHDYDVANALNIDCALIPGGHASINRLRNTGALIYTSINELMGDILKP